MRHLTLQEHYNLIIEGKGNKLVFIRESKRNYPQHIRNAAGFEETVTVLKQNHIIFEGVKSQINEAEDFVKLFKKNITENLEIEPYDHGDRNSYDPSDRENLDNISPNQFAIGFQAEICDIKNKDKTTQEIQKIVHKNLIKDPLHYVKDGVGGIKGVGYIDDLPGLTVSKPLKGKYVSSGYGDLKESRRRKNPINENRFQINDDRAIRLSTALDKWIKFADYESIEELTQLIGNINFFEDLTAEQWDEIENYLTQKQDFESEDKKENYYLDLDDINESKSGRSRVISLVKLFEDSDRYYMNHNREPKKKDDKPKRPKVQDITKSIEREGNIASLAAKIEAFDSEIEKRQDQLNMVQENDDLADFLNPKKIKDMEKEIKDLTKAKEKYEKNYEKLADKPYESETSEEVVTGDEVED